MTAKDLTWVALQEKKMEETKGLYLLVNNNIECHILN